MAKEYDVLCNAHNSIYIESYLENNYNKRKCKVYFSIPEKGTDEETGLLLLIPGLGVNSQNNIYKKMRNNFADIYNLVTISCDFFGQEFQNPPHSDILLPAKFFENLKECMKPGEIKKIKKQAMLGRKEIESIKIKEGVDKVPPLKFHYTTDETLEYCNDMGIMQAIDNITATLKVMNILYENECKFNTKKVIIKGVSHGAYLGYLANACCQGLFTHILDNSSWIMPSFMGSLSRQYENGISIQGNTKYLLAEKGIDLEYLHLGEIYKTLNNKCKIVSYHGERDALITINDKKNVIDKIENIIFNEVTEENRDDKIFKSSEHGLDANFINLFEEFHCKYVDVNRTSDTLTFENDVIIGEKFHINYNEGVPFIYLLKNN